MAYLMQIGFSNTARLYRRTFYFEYKGIRFKLIQNNSQKWCDALLTIIPDSFGPGQYSDEDTNRVYDAASEFLSTLSWENDSLVRLEYSGGRGARKNYQLRNAKTVAYTFPMVPFRGYSIGSDISRIPNIKTSEQRDALVLFREASSTNNNYLALIFFWQILEIGKNDAIGWLNKTYQNHLNKIRVLQSDLDQLPIKHKRIGNYFYDDCRNAIAHLFKRKTGSTKIKIDTLEDNLRIVISKRVIEEFARYFIKDRLQLNSHMYLVRKNGRGFPVYLPVEETAQVHCKLAYQRPSSYKLTRKSWH